MKIKKITTICALVACLSLTGCRALTGMAGGMINKPVEETKHYYANTEGKIQKLTIPIIMVPYGVANIAIGAWEGFYWGLEADFYYLDKGKNPENYKWLKPWDRE